MSEVEWTKDLSLLLIYKDPLGRDPLAGSYRRLPSFSIQQHVELARPPEKGSGPKPQAQFEERLTRSAQLPLFGTLSGNPRCSREVPPGCCVWGWWRKGWETHHRLLAALSRYLMKGHKPSVLLYNQYLRLLYKATLHDLYFERFLSSVIIPEAWQDYCPETYRSVPHLCGAFFLLEIDPLEKSAAELNLLFTDSQSFELRGSPLFAAPPEGVDAACARMIDSPPLRKHVRASEQTIFVVRRYKQREETSNILRKIDSAGARQLREAIAETTWRDLLDLLRDAPPRVWEVMAEWSDCVSEIGRAAWYREPGDDAESLISGIAHSPMTRFDFELFAKLVASDELRDLLRSREHPSEFNLLGKALLRWLTVSTQREAREEAAAVFAQAWAVAAERYALEQMPVKYFRNLPAIEAITSAVKYEIGKKFYRDHLSHNVRAALLSAALAGRATEVASDALNLRAAAFFSGLFHDIALPLSTFPDTMVKLASALEEAQGSQASGQLRVATILDRHRLNKSLNYVAMLASIRNLKQVSATASFRPWESQEDVLALTDPQVLMEVLLCLTSEEHALVSAALLFDYAVQGAANGGDLDTAIRTLISRVMGPAASSHGREFACVLQSIALHDRRPAAKHHGVLEPPKDTPKPLQFEDFPLPVVVTIADELQEWGRTLGALDEIGAVDAEVSLTEDRIRARYSLRQSAELFSSIPFSPLEYLFGKFRTLGRLTHAGADGPTAFDIALRVESLQAFVVSYLAPGSECRIELREPFQFIDFPKWPEVSTPRQVPPLPELSLVLGIGVRSEAPRIRDVLVVTGDETLLAIIRNRAAGAKALSGLEIGTSKLRLELDGGPLISISLSDYRFGHLSPKTAPANLFPNSGEVVVLLGQIASVEPGDENLRDERDRLDHLDPHPHFLDFDWRFDTPTCRASVNFVREVSQENPHRVCYLGCPSLAVWHAAHFPQDKNWRLLDRGHFALETWLEKERIPRDMYTQYDVFSPLEKEYEHIFDIVVADPPWYEPEYQLFAKRAVQLVRSGGILGITFYPPSLDRGKFDRFQRMVFQEIVHEFRQFGSLEIAYSPPPFEVAAGIQTEFQHPELGIYRAGFLDFFMAPEEFGVVSEVGGLRSEEVGRFFPSVRKLPEGHHLRLRALDSLNQLGFPLRVLLTRRGIKRIKDVPDRWIGWSSLNTIVKITRGKSGHEVASVDDLVGLVSRIEQEGRKLPMEKL